MGKIDSFEKIMSLTRQWQESRLFLTSIELKIYDYLEKEKSSRALADFLNVSERHLDRLLNALVVLGLLDKNDDLFKNTDVSNNFLNSNSENYILSMNHANHMYHYWASLTEVIRKGVPARELENVTDPENWVNDFISAMQQHGGSRAEEVIELIDFKNCKKFLDLGGGSGAFTSVAAKTFLKTDFFIFDLPDVIPITEKFVNKDKVLNNVNFIKGDYLNDNFGFGYDIIFISNIIHSLSVNEMELIFGKCFNSLNNGGKLIIHDFLIDSERTSPDWAVFFAINMLVHTKEGDTYTEGEVRKLVEKVGFNYDYCVNTKSNSNLLVCSKI